MKHLHPSRYRTGHYLPGAQTGFTLIELIVTMSIAAILLTIAVPSFQTTIANNRLTTQTNNLVTDLNITRSEAVKRGTSVVLCSSATPNAATPTCTGAGNTWTTGWLVFVDIDASGAFNAGDTLIKVGQPSDGDSTVLASAGINTFTYLADGTSTTASFAICDNRGTNFGRQIRIIATGRPRLITGSSAMPLASCVAPI